MSFRKKVTVSTLAVSMVAATLAGVPLSSKGFANQVGALTVSAATGSNLELVKSKLDKVYGELGDGGRASLRALRSEIDSKIDKTVFISTFEDILSKTTEAGVSEDVLFDLFEVTTGLFYDPSYQNLVEIRNNPTYIEAAKKLGEAGGVSDLSVDDLVDFTFGKQGVEETLVGIIKTKKLSELASLVNDSEARNQLLRDAYKASLNTSVGGKNLSVIFDSLGITENQVAEAVKGIQAKLDPKIVKEATMALALAYIAAEDIDLKPETPVDPGPGNPGTGGGGGGAIGGGGGGAAGGGDGAVETPAPSGSLAELSVIDASKLIKVEGDTATLELKEADVLKLLEAIKATASGQKDLVLTLDLGKVNAANISVPLSKAIVEAAKAAGISKIEIIVNGLKVTLPIGQFTDAINLSIAKKEDATATSITSLKLASDVYEFGLKVGGAAVSAFRSPITISIPLRDVQVDKELLSVAKIVNGTLQFQGGVVNGNVIVEPRDTFSAYAVVENKVVFNDIAKVQSWAGRQIEVVAAKGAIEGKAAGVFAPQASVTRAEFAKMLIRALNLENSFDTESFNDVNTNDWFAPYVASAVQLGIINGRSAEQFAPQDQITRAEMATMISRALKVTHKLDDAANIDATLNQFSDAGKISNSLKQGVAFAAANNLVIGNDGKFNPNSNATRAEAAVIIYRTMNFKTK